MFDVLVCCPCECAIIGTTRRRQRSIRTNEFSFEDTQGWRNCWRKQIVLLYQKSRMVSLTSLFFCSRFCSLLLFLTAIIDGYYNGDGDGDGDGILFRPDNILYRSPMLTKMEIFGCEFRNIVSIFVSMLLTKTANANVNSSNDRPEHVTFVRCQEINRYCFQGVHCIIALIESCNELQLTVYNLFEMNKWSQHSGITFVSKKVWKIRR